MTADEPAHADPETLLAEAHQHCDPWGHCLHSDTPENRLLDRIGFEPSRIRRDPHCPLCEQTYDR